MIFWHENGSALLSSLVWAVNIKFPLCTSRNILFPWLIVCLQGHTLSITTSPFPSLAVQIIPWPSFFSRADNQGEFSLLLLTKQLS